ncbi:uncharacterized protein PV07_10383 [Cladophialophora immunda]|uniref:Protein kinase domain-containing protein n=1 Tax=Cladophialophora immunda TaxID=569365 RepID=A0A0D1ZAF1_9EURO|nr:uncharacterized protein PV07_10383 [Cladophialophora immunda]KIW24681.1 hypothetical protein PV07_10383 [Cladophialophora immunda]
MTPSHAADREEEGWEVGNLRYALLGKGLDKAIDELEVWHRTFDQSWYLIMKAATPQIDAELDNLNRHHQPGHARASISSARLVRAALNDQAGATTPIFLRADGLDSIQVSAIPLCSAEFGRRVNSTSDVILDHITLPVARANARAFKRSIRDLVRKLSHADPLTFGLLNCKGVVEHGDSTTPSSNADENQSTVFTMVFRLPREFSSPRSLRNWLLDSEATHSLSARFKMAAQLAQSIGHVHTFGFVHKNILPETILVMDTPLSMTTRTTAPTTVHAVCMVGFGNFRDAEGSTLRTGTACGRRTSTATRGARA